MKKIIIIIFFTFYAPNVYAINILKLGKFFNEVADEVVEIFAEIIY